MNPQRNSERFQHSSSSNFKALIDALYRALAFSNGSSAIGSIAISIWIVA